MRCGSYGRHATTATKSGEQPKGDRIATAQSAAAMQRSSLLQTADLTYSQPFGVIGKLSSSASNRLPIEDALHGARRSALLGRASKPARC